MLNEKLKENQVTKLYVQIYFQEMIHKTIQKEKVSDTFDIILFLQIQILILYIYIPTYSFSYSVHYGLSQAIEL